MPVQKKSGNLLNSRRSTTDVFYKNDFGIKIFS